MFHAGTKMEHGNYYTSGGRVLGVGAGGASLPEATEVAYDAASRIKISGAHYRRDIGIASRSKSKAVAEALNG